MANEFIARNGLIAQNNSTITGSLNVTGGITGSLLGTSSYALTASYIANPLITTNRQTGSYTLVLSDAGKLVEMNSGSAITLTVPTSSTSNFDIGTQMMISQYGLGQLSILTGSSNVFVRSAGYRYKLANQYSGATLIKIAIDEWYLFGDLVP